MHIYCIAAYIPDLIVETFIYNLQSTVSRMQDDKHVDKVHPDDFLLRMQVYVFSWSMLNLLYRLLHAGGWKHLLNWNEVNKQPQDNRWRSVTSIYKTIWHFIVLSFRECIQMVWYVISSIFVPPAD